MQADELVKKIQEIEKSIVHRPVKKVAPAGPISWQEKDWNPNKSSLESKDEYKKSIIYKVENVIDKRVAILNKSSFEFSDELSLADLYFFEKTVALQIIGLDFLFENRCIYQAFFYFELNAKGERCIEIDFVLNRDRISYFDQCQKKRIQKISKKTLKHVQYYLEINSYYLDKNINLVITYV